VMESHLDVHFAHAIGRPRPKVPAQRVGAA
jgi:hypothetical protein